MSLDKLVGEKLAQMVQMGAANLAQNADYIDKLNVFPVPDGDTGTNMNLSMTSGAKEVKHQPATSVGAVAGAFAKGLLMGARGNSGVILSQLFRGFAKELENVKEADTVQFAAALDAGVQTAYKAVMKPVEGTILTVARETAESAIEAALTEKDMVVFMATVVDSARTALKRTPELLPVLKEVGVVDSGGQGLLTIYEGFLASLKGEAPKAESETVAIEELVNAEHHRVAQDFMNTEDIKYGYCTEFMVKFDDEKLAQHPYDETAFRNALAEQGDSLLVASDEQIAKVHVHTEYPGQAMTLGQQYGSLINIKVENMREQHMAIIGNKEVEQAPAEKTAYAVIAIAMGNGISNLFENLGANVIQGGQTMNPSTQDIAEAIAGANAEQVIILPNNKNIVMAAEQAAELAELPAKVVPAKTIPQGISAMLAFNPDMEIERNVEMMSAAAAHVKTGQVTHAVRDTTIEGLQIKSGQFMGIADGSIKTSADSCQDAAEQLLHMLITEDDEILTIIFGEGTTLEGAEKLARTAEELNSDIEVEIHEGNQPIYSYIFAVE
ncbi:DAK2 domain-containing protein [Aciduricibacillus chroicocephali]|uniref:DAK2 domain-containing protein n=1 Tax=Aciduricibacillus chroicocephali TaxID=3054939 RepID=A0ABY9KYS5_9BACI|nr:DAK2 domain-containing protein [Bacillaceae bacterium 44XB]